MKEAQPKQQFLEGCWLSSPAYTSRLQHQKMLLALPLILPCIAVIIMVLTVEISNFHTLHVLAITARPRCVQERCYNISMS